MMQRSALFKAAITTLLWIFFLSPAHAQTFLEQLDQLEAKDRSTATRFLENQISSPSMQFRLNGLKGTLSSNLTLESITIADAEGVWMAIEEPQLVWSKSQLFLGALVIEKLVAKRIFWQRNPLPDNTTPSPEAKPFSLPKLPVSLQIEQFEIGEVVFAQDVFGLEAVISASGRLNLANGNLSSEFAMQRIDGPGGNLGISLEYSEEMQEIDLDFSLSEPANGVLANALGIYNKPSLDLALKGAGNFDNLDIDLNLSANGKTALGGTLALNDSFFSDDRRISLDLSGPIHELLNPQLLTLLGKNSNLSADAVLRKSGVIELEKLNLQSGQVQLTGAGKTFADGFLDQLTLKGSLGAGQTEPTSLALASQTTQIQSAIFNLSYRTNDPEKWSINIEAQGLETPSYRLGKAQFIGGGVVLNAKSATDRVISFALKGDAENIITTDKGLANALGDTVSILAKGRWISDQPFALEDFLITTDTAKANLQGSFFDTIFTGRMTLLAQDLSRFSTLAGQPLAGTGLITADGDIDFSTFGVDLNLQGDLTGLSVANPKLKNLFTGRTKLSGALVRNENGLSFSQLNLRNNQLSVILDGAYSSSQADLGLTGQIYDLKSLEPNARGRLEIKAKIAKPMADIALGLDDRPYDIHANLSLEDAALMGRDIPALAANFSGQSGQNGFAGTLNGAGRVGQDQLNLHAELFQFGDLARISDLTFSLGTTQIAGSIETNGNLADGSLTVEAEDISPVAALALLDASGSVAGKIDLNWDGQTQSVNADLDLSQLRYEGYRIGRANLSSTIKDAFGQPRINADLSASKVRVANIGVNSLNMSARTSEATISFSGNADLDNGVAFSTKGTAKIAGSTRIDLSKFEARTPVGPVRLRKPASFVQEQHITRINNLDLAIGSGTISLQGIIGSQLRISGAISKLPLSLANSFAPNLAANGVVSGQFKTFGLKTAPKISYNLNGTGITSKHLQVYGVSPLTFSASGTADSNQIMIDQGRLRNDQNIDIQTTGRFPLTPKTGMNLNATGTAPLALANRFTGARDTRLAGDLAFNASMAGSTSSPQISGSASLRNGSIVDPLSNISLSDVTADVTMKGQSAFISNARATIKNGGTLSASGQIGLQGVFPANLNLSLENARYTDASTFSAIVDGSFKLTGGLVASPLISGTATIRKMDITIPDTFGSGSELLKVEHLRPDADTRRTLAFILDASPQAPENEPSAPARLDVVINAPGRIFVRGRGLDAELGGSMRAQGAIDNIQPTGAFSLIRGRLSILNKRLDFTEGKITLTGSLDPFLNFLAEVVDDEVTAYIRLRGRSSNLTVELDSNPALPDDEILASIMFGQSISNLSPLQIASLGAAAASLTGGGGANSLSGRIRAGLGVDDLDIAKDDEGNTAVKAGKYLGDNVYVDVQSSKSTTKATINLDITNSLKVQGSVDNKGKSKLGVFFERDF